MTKRPDPDRRAVLAAALLFPFASAAKAQGLSAPAAIPPAFRAIVVDTSPLLAFGGAASAEILDHALTGQLRKVFADRLNAADAHAPTLVARISHFFLASFGGENSFAGLGPNDNIEGDGLVSLGNRVLSTTHILTELSPSYSGSFNTPGVDAIRYQSIAYQFAYWLRREMNI